ncbi:hypothetical protein llg_28660 [Luteolibacter sp. LG18]|nr:hypothetical protein llg_28660 [Luteolibacter sp. LG18]
MLVAAAFALRRAPSGGGSGGERQLNAWRFRSGGGSSDQREDEVEEFHGETGRGLDTIDIDRKGLFSPAGATQHSRWREPPVGRMAVNQVP